MKVSRQSIEALVEVINDSVNRTGLELVGFFNQFNLEHSYPESVHSSGSKAKYTRDTLIELNGSAVLDSVILSAVHPQNYIGKPTNVEDVVTSLNQFLEYDGYDIIKVGNVYSIRYNNVMNSNNLKNLIFAADGPKPEIVLLDTLNYDVDVVSNKQHVLIYDQPITGDGLSWNTLVKWWATQYNINANEHRLFYHRLERSLGSHAEKLFFRTYYEIYNPTLYTDFPILIPQVYLHYDPYTLRQLNGIGRIPRQRMDFLLLIPEHKRIVIEIDGKQHYTNERTTQSSPRKYAEMVAEDRRIKLSGYEVYRFGGYEFNARNPTEEAQAKRMIKDFFGHLFAKHGLTLKPATSTP